MSGKGKRAFVAIDDGYDSDEMAMGDIEARPPPAKRAKRVRRQLIKSMHIEEEEDVGPLVGMEDDAPIIELDEEVQQQHPPNYHAEISPQENDVYDNLVSHCLIIDNQDICALMNDYLDRSVNRQHTRNFLILYQQGVFGSFFTLLQLLGNAKERLDVVASEQARLQTILDADVKQRKLFNKMSKAMHSGVARVSIFSGSGKFKSGPYEVIIPVFGCAQMALTWDKFAHPYDTSHAINGFTIKPNNDILAMKRSGDQQQGAFIGGNSSLYRTTLSCGRVFTVGLNVSALERLLVANGNNFDQVPYAEFLRSHIKYKIGVDIHPSSDFANNVGGNETFTGHLPKAIPPDFATLEWIHKMARAFESNLKIDLYEYQKDAVTWMMAVESGSISTESTYIVNYQNFKFDVINNQLVVANNNPTLGLRPVPYKGGLLADEMGLGKTVEMLALVVANHPLMDNNQPKEVFVENPHDKTAILKSRATLVVAPNHLVTPVWKHIFEQSVHSSRSIITLTTKYDFHKITVKQMMDADLIVVSAEFLEGDIHLRAKDARLDIVSFDTTTVHNRTKAYYRKLADTLKTMDKKAVLNLSGVPLHLFHWHRLVIDESHCLLAKDKLTPLLLDLVSTHVWCVSATPFTTYEVFYYMCTLLGVYSDIPACKWKVEHNHTALLQQDWFDCLASASQRMIVVPETLMWRSTKRGIAAQLTIPSMVEFIHVLEFTPMERMLYTKAANEKDGSSMRELCCHVRVPGENGEEGVIAQHKTLDEIGSILIESRKHELKTIKADHGTHEAKLQHNQTKLQNLFFNATPNSPNIQQRAEKILSKISTIEGEMKSNGERVRVLEREIGYFEGVLTIRNSVRFYEEIGMNAIVGNICPVCMEDVITRPALTSCGHLFCADCIHRCARSQGKCPICKASIERQLDVFNVDINDKAVSSELSELVNRYGTKMGNLIHHLRQIWTKDPTEKVIIFSSSGRDDSNAVRLGQFLALEQIKTVFCKGNVHMKNKAFAQFNDPKANVQVMILSLEKSAAGSNLTAASEIILLDSIWEGNLAEQLATELQALNRAHRVGQTKKVRIVRMLIRDTIETERFKLHYPDFDQTQSLVVRDLDLRTI